MLLPRWLFLLLAAGLGLGPSCRFSPPDESADYPVGTLPYNLNQPNQKYFLNDDLEEISGIAYSQSHQLACVQDEEGKLFVYDIGQKRIVQRVMFGKNGDYEDVALVNGDVYTLRSDGTLFRFRPNGRRKASATELDTPLSARNDVEGLAYDPSTHRLFLLCKGEAGIGGEKIAGKAIYAYDLATGVFDKSPAWTILPDRLRPTPAIQPGNRDENQPRTTRKKRDRRVDFQPSGLAIHPRSRQLYVVASDGKLLVVLNRDGKIAECVRLNPRLFKQPEGICFAPNGDLFIASEGRDNGGYILRFKLMDN